MKQIYGPKTDINKADVSTMMNEYSYAAFIGVLSNIYMKAHASSPFRGGPYEAVLIISKSMLQPFKGQPESSVERIKAIVERMYQPQGGINLAIFVGECGMFVKKSKIGLKHTVSQSWPLKNSISDKKIITVNLPPKQLQNGENAVRYFTKNDIHQTIKNARYVDYDTPIINVFKSLANSKCHICYQGGTAWLSVSMNIPTIIVHRKPIKDGLHIKPKLFGQDLGNINILKNEKIKHVRKHPREQHISLKQLPSTLRKL